MPWLGAPSSAGQPTQGSASDADLGTMIYLLGTQSSSMNARQVVRRPGASR